MFTNVNLFRMNGFVSRRSSRTSLAFTFVNGKTLLNALGVNTLIRKLIMNCRNSATGRHLLGTMNRISHEYSRTSFSDPDRGIS